MIVAKFGGSSLADAAGFRTAEAIVRADPRRRGVVVSAPGKRAPGDRKLTDCLYDLWERRDGAWQPLLKEIYARFDEIAKDLGVRPDWQEGRELLTAGLASGKATRDFVASRGEYFCAKLLAAYLDRPFLDSADWLRMNPDGTADETRSYAALQSRAGDGFITPGFYGALADGTIRTFPRGGSDITGALAAAALRAERYENWTDVPGILEADPADFPEARPVRYLTYPELTALGDVGVQVLHSGAIRPVREAGIPLTVRSTRQPIDPGTQIAAELPEGVRRGRVLLLGSRKGRDGRLIAVIFAKEATRGVKPTELPALLEQNGVPILEMHYSGIVLHITVPEEHYHRAVRVLLQAARLPEDADPFGA